MTRSHVYWGDTLGLSPEFVQRDGILVVPYEFPSMAFLSSCQVRPPAARVDD
jgi:hypothetical protein